jgi:hypothetical protein
LHRRRFDDTLGVIPERIMEHRRLTDCAIDQVGHLSARVPADHDSGPSMPTPHLMRGAVMSRRGAVICSDIRQCGGGDAEATAIARLKPLPRTS